ncbi:MAG: DUF6520 family protein, partial [Daejeonella sp.]
MKRIKINLAVIAMILAASAAFAFKSPPPKSTSVLYQRISLTSEVWEVATSSECDPAQNVICKAYFSYDPNGQTQEYNEANVDQVINRAGYAKNRHDVKLNNASHKYAYFIHRIYLSPKNFL